MPFCSSFSPVRLRALLAAVCLGFVAYVYGNDIESADTSICGGFVTSDFPVDYSKIEVHLLDRHGNLKYQAPCSTNNGNYEVPVFGQKGDFFLAISAPEGLAFEPKRVPIKIDGKTDPCSKQENINFRFLGYSLSGKVQSKNSPDGPAGVSVTILDKQNKELQTVATYDGGSFVFSNLLPGEYTVVASHKDFTIANSTLSATITDSVAHLPENSLVISGYPVTGTVQSSQEPVENVVFVLYSKSIAAADVSGCEKTTTNSLSKDHPQYGSQLCEAKSNAKGLFRFGSLVPGSYVMVPTYSGGTIKYNIEPSSYALVMGHQATIVDQTFEVKGFTASGSVLTSAKGSGVPSADIFVNGTLTTKTDRNGVYRLEKTSVGWYKIEAKKEYYEFPASYVKISPTEPSVAPIIARSISVCGAIQTLRPLNRPLTFETLNIHTQIPRDTVIQNEKFCVLLETGEYKVSVFDAPADHYQRLTFSPAEKVIKVKDFPITDLLFKQVVGTVSGTVRCIGDCPKDLRVSLLTSGGESFANVKVDGVAGSFKFDGVDLGTHPLQIVEPTKRACWDLTKKSVELTAAKPTATIGFKQTGFLLEIWSSHNAELSYTLPGKDARKQEKLKNGFTETCLSEAGIYELLPSGGHRFEQTSYTYSTLSPARVNLQAVSHATNISVNTDDTSATFKLRIMKNSDGSSSILTPSGSPKTISPGTYQYNFVEYFPSDEDLTIVPFSDVLIFKPTQADLLITDEVSKNVVLLEAFKGVMIAGTLTPPVADVDVVLTTENEVLRGKTDERGGYSLGPVVRSVIKSIVAEKRGYEFEAVVDSTNFRSTKLSEIRVQTLDAASQPVASVLVSISNSVDFRTSSFTDQAGEVSFVNVAPGDYLVRPMVKEFRFDPASKSVSLAQGKTSEVSWTGTRIAYSAFGRVASVGSDPEAGIKVEAVSKEPCPQMHEESETATNGNFRISGLKAGCKYTVRVKEDELAGMDIKWTSPSNRTIDMTAADFTGVNFIVFRGYNDVSFTGYVDTTKEFLTGLKVCLYRAERMSEPVQCVSFTINPMFHFETVPLDQRAYVIRLDSTLSRKEFVYTPYEINVKANSTFQHYHIPFSAVRKQLDPEISPGAIWIVPLAVLASVLYVYRESLLPFALTAVERFGSVSKFSPKRDKRRSPPGTGLPSALSETAFEDYGVPVSKRKTKTGK